MTLRMDFSRREVLRFDEAVWVDSPATGVQRFMLSRDGDEAAIATSFVRFAPNSTFMSHQHPDGEELMVLEGGFSDEHGHYPAGTYLRNPHGSSHAPHTDTGCLLYVKLRQFQEADTTQIAVETNHSTQWIKPPGDAQGVDILPLHRYGDEFVRLVRFQAGGQLGHHPHPKGEEIVILDGTLHDEDGTYPKYTWLRSPPGSAHAPYSSNGALVLVKSGHL